MNLDPDEADRRSGHAYVDLLEMVEGTEGDEVFQTIIDSMVAVEDYEVVMKPPCVSQCASTRPLRSALVPSNPGRLARPRS